jgi:hypothetical protein
MPKAKRKLVQKALSFQTSRQRVDLEPTAYVVLKAQQREKRTACQRVSFKKSR